MTTQPDETLLRQIITDVERLVARHQWEGTPRKRMAFLLREVVELAGEVLQLSPAGPLDEAHRQRLGREIYDVLWNTCDLARLVDVDVVEAAADKRQFNQGRVWPVHETQ